MATIRLYTLDVDDITWEYHAKKHGDKYFSTFLAGLEEATGVLPDELRLEGGVANIVESQWDAYKGIWAASRVVETTLTAMKEIKQENEGEINYLSPLQIIPTYTVPTHLDQVFHIAQILDMPRGWEAYVMVSRTDPLKSQVNHLIASANALTEMGVDMANVGPLLSLRKVYPSSTTVAVLTLLARATYRCNGGEEMQYNEYVQKVNMATVALLHNEQLKSMSRYSNETTLYDVLWAAVPDILKRLGVGEVPKELRNGRTVHLGDLALFLLGKGNAFEIPYDLITVHTNPPSVDIAEGGDLERLYNAVWDSIPDDVVPYIIGLDGYITRTATHIDYERMGATSFLRRIHRAIIHPFFTKKHGKFAVEDFRCVITLLGMSIVKEHGLKRITTCLEKYLPSAGEKDKQRIHHFLHYAKYYECNNKLDIARLDFPSLAPGVTIQSIADDLFKDCSPYIAPTD